VELVIVMLHHCLQLHGEFHRGWFGGVDWSRRGQQQSRAKRDSPPYWKQTIAGNGKDAFHGAWIYRQGKEKWRRLTPVFAACAP
jgi:hypothetical protein